MSSAVLQPPAARQGPGPIPQPLVEALDLAVSRLVARMLPGDRRAAGVGAGTELAQLRLERATAAFEAIQRAAVLLGAPLAGVLIGFFAPSTVLWGDAASFLVSAALAPLILVIAVTVIRVRRADLAGG